MSSIELADENGSVWLFNLQSHNWAACRDGPPDLPVHGEHVGHPFHGLAGTTAHHANDMEEGELAIVRQSGEGIEELWTIKETTQVQDQRHHNWVTEDGQPATYDEFIYCRRLTRFDPPVKSTSYQVKGTDFASFNKGANELSDDHARMFLDVLIENAPLDSATQRRLEVVKKTIEDSDDIISETGPSSDTDNVSDGSSSRGEGAKPGTEDTTGQPGSSGGNAPQISNQFRRDILQLYQNKCLLSEFRGSPFLTVSHVVPRAADYDLVEHPDNVIVLCWDLHAAFDDDLFTLDSDLRIQVAPEFEPVEPFLQRTIVSREGEKVKFPSEMTVEPEFLERRNKNIEWF